MKYFSTVATLLAFLSISFSAVVAEPHKPNQSNDALIQVENKRALRGVGSSSDSNNDHQIREIQRSLQEAQQSTPSDLAMAESLWASWRIYNYQYQFVDNGHNPHGIVYPWTVTVQNQVSASGWDGNGNPIPSGGSRQPETIEDHFNRIRNAFNTGVAFISVTYDPFYGFPSHSYIIYNESVETSTYDGHIYSFVGLCPAPSGSSNSCPATMDPVKCQNPNGSPDYCIYDNECVANSLGMVGCTPY